MRWQIREFAEEAGVSVRTLHYYDEIGLLKPAAVDPYTGYRYYDEASLLRMQEILFYRELEFPLKDIVVILTSPGYDSRQALRKQKELLTIKKERLERLIAAVDRAVKEENIMKEFNNRKFEQQKELYQKEAKEKWGKTAAYAEYEQKTAGRSAGKQEALGEGLMQIMASFSDCMRSGAAPESEDAQALVEKLQGYITDHYYTCTKEILAGLGQMYVADERFRTNIDASGEGTAAYISRAVEQYCQ